MKPLKKIAGINLLVLLVYSLFIRMLSISEGRGSNDNALGIMLVSAFLVGIHVFICIVVTIAEYARHKPELARAWILSALIVLLVGFSACLGNAALG